MSVIYVSTLRTTRMTDVLTAIGANGYFVIGDTSLAAPSTGVLVKLPLGNPSGSVSGDVLTLLGTGTSNALTANIATGGTATKAAIWTSANAAIVTGLTVGTGANDVVLSNNVLAANNTLTIASANATITHPST